MRYCNDFGILDEDVPSVKLFELLSPAVGEPGTLVRTHEAPHAILLDPLHEEVRNPHGVEEIAGALFLLAVVLAQVEEVEYVAVPWLDVYGKRAGAFVATLRRVSFYSVKNFAIHKICNL